MEALVAILGVSVAVCAAAWHHTMVLRAQREALDAVANATGLIRYPDEFLVHNGCLKGLLDGLPVEMTLHRRKGKILIRLTVRGADPSLSLHKESVGRLLGSAFQKWVEPETMTPWEREGDQSIGDGPFDDQVDLRGPRPLLGAVLDGEGRTEVLQWVEGLGGRVREGTVSLEVEERRLAPERLMELLRAAHGVARRLRPREPDEIKRALIANFRGDLSPYVRKHCLAALGEAFPGDPDTLAVSREALTDTTYDWIPMHGAANLGAEGIPTYRRILADPRQRDAIHAMCVRHLGHKLPEAEAETFLLEQLLDHRSAVAFAAATVLAERAGTAQAVPALTEAARRHASADVRKAAKAALEAIAVRLEGVEAGTLALAEAGEEGRLSRAEGSPPHPPPTRSRLPS